MSRIPEQAFADKILEPSAAKTIIDDWKARGNKIVFTNGVFDLVHQGHVRYLAKAAAEGDKLIIGLNTDRSVSAIKGPSRPVNSEDSRAILLAAFYFVDAVILFDDDNPLSLIKLIMPDVLVKGADYTVENIVGSNEVTSNGGVVKLIEFTHGYSSTAIINKILGI